MGQSIGIEVCRSEACRSFIGEGDASGEECPRQNLGDSMTFTKLPATKQQEVPGDWQLVPRKINPADFVSLPPLTEENGTMLEPITEDAEEGMVSQYAGLRSCKDESTTIPSTDEGDSDGQPKDELPTDGQEVPPRASEAAGSVNSSCSSSSSSLGLSSNNNNSNNNNNNNNDSNNNNNDSNSNNNDSNNNDSNNNNNNNNTAPPDAAAADRAAPAKAKKKKAAKTAPKTKESKEKEAEDERKLVQKRREANQREQQRQQALLEAMGKEDANSDSDSEIKLDVCPGSKKDKDFERELKKVKRKMRQAEAAATGGVTPQDDGTWRDVNPLLNSQASEQERKLKKDMILSFYRDEFTRVAKEKGETAAAEAGPDLKQYDDGAMKGLKIQGGHRYMPRPDGVDLPQDFRKDVGVLTKEQLATYGADNDRILVCIHGDLFDVSDRPDKYGTEGPYWYMAGHDITWGFVIADDGEEWIDIYYDVFKIYPAEKSDRKLQGLLSWWAFYEKEYGSPVGRLDVYEKEWKLPAPPKESMENECSIM